MDASFEDQSKLPELKLGKPGRNPSFAFWLITFIICIFSLVSEYAYIVSLNLLHFLLDAKQSQGFLSFFKTLPHVSILFLAPMGVSLW